jgi:hypothetical protein
MTMSQTLAMPPAMSSRMVVLRNPNVEYLVGSSMTVEFVKDGKDMLTEFEHVFTVFNEFGEHVFTVLKEFYEYPTSE